jgi:protocatechuate 3,4-dioxygenase beta subunit
MADILGVPISFFFADPQVDGCPGTNVDVRSYWAGASRHGILISFWHTRHNWVASEKLDMSGSTLPRRKLLYAPMAYAAASGLFRFPAAATNTLQPTPAQIAGPFYPTSFPWDSDNDLVHVAGHPAAAHGVPANISGHVLDLNGRPISGARVEIWQCDANGRYHYVQDGRSDQPRDGNFQGYGATTTDLDGRYQFLTIKPVPYPGRSPHIHFAVSGHGFERFITQMYVAGESRNESDPLLMGIRDPGARARLVVALQPQSEASATGLAGTFDIVLVPR